MLLLLAECVFCLYSFKKYTDETVNIVWNPRNNYICVYLFTGCARWIEAFKRGLSRESESVDAVFHWNNMKKKMCCGSNFIIPYTHWWAALWLIVCCKRDFQMEGMLLFAHFRLSICVTHNTVCVTPSSCHAWCVRVTDNLL